MEKNQFPLQIFPVNIMRFVNEANKCYGYNKDFFCISNTDGGFYCNRT